MNRSNQLVGIFAFTLVFFSCSGQDKKNGKAKVPDSIEKVMSKAAADFNNRPIYKVLTANIIDKTPDNKLLEMIFDNLSEKMPKDFDQEYNAVSNFSKPRQAVYIIWILEAEINNGGFNQYYYNSSGQFAKLTPTALRLVGANRFANLVTNANQVYENENKKITKNQDGTLKGFSKSYVDNPLNKFDDQFYKLYTLENLHELQIKFIRKNKTEFVDK